jgi:hypothetical protein
MDDENEPLRIALEDTKFTLSLRDAALLVARESAAINAESARVAWQTAQRLEAQVERLRDLLGEVVADSATWYYDREYMHEVCVFCDSHEDAHTPKCVVARARAALERIPKP